MIRPDASAVGVAILARAPVPGLAKTRLIPALGDEGAARLQSWLIRHTVAKALDAGVGPVSVWCAGDLQHPAFNCYDKRDRIDMRTQPEGDLGWRMLSAIRESAGPRGVVVIGTDCPALTPAHLRQAAERLQHRDAVIFPAEDGGYVLIGMRKPILPTLEQVFEQIDWGSDRVMAQTRERLRMSGCAWDESTTLWDVDRPEDLPRLFALCPELEQIADFEVRS